MNGRKRPLRVAVLIETSRAYGRGLCRGVARYAREHGPWSLFVEERDLHEALPKWLKAWDGDGILARIENDRMARTIEKMGLPTVDLLGKQKRPDIPMLDSDPVAIGQLAADFYLDAGFEQFAFCGYPGIYFSDRRGAAFVDRLAERGYDCYVYTPPVGSPKSTDILLREQQGMAYEAAIGKWLAGLPRPLALLACNDVRGRQVLNACREAGAGCPDEVAVMGVDNDDVVCDLSTPPLTSIEPDVHRLGFLAAAWLDALIAGQPPSEEPVYMPPKGVVERQSTEVVPVSDPLTAAAIQFIRDHACEGINVEQVLEHVDRSRTALEQRFRKTIGRTIKAEIQRVRLYHVRQHLYETNLTLPVIARQTGYRTAAHMSHVFKRELGGSPSSYRSKLREL